MPISCVELRQRAETHFEAQPAALAPPRYRVPPARQRGPDLVAKYLSTVPPYLYDGNQIAENIVGLGLERVKGRSFGKLGEARDVGENHGDQLALAAAVGSGRRPAH